jgi:hypothetical protein
VRLTRAVASGIARPLVLVERRPLSAYAALTTLGDVAEPMYTEAIP